MDLAEASQLTSEQEYRHWWIRTRFSYLERAFAFLPEARLDVLEIGCGTGQNLRYLEHESRHGERIAKLIGIDPALAEETPARRASARGFASEFDLVLAMDVLEHIDDDFAALVEWRDYLKPGAVLFLTAPAFPALWSQHDVLLRHYRRYTARSLLDVTRRAGFTALRVRYAFGHVFPIAYVTRRLLGLNRDAQETDLRPTGALANRVLTGIGRAEAALGGNPLLGTSVIGYFRRPSRTTVTTVQAADFLMARSGGMSTVGESS